MLLFSRHRTTSTRSITTLTKSLLLAIIVVMSITPDRYNQNHQGADEDQSYDARQRRLRAALTGLQGTSSARRERGRLLSADTVISGQRPSDTELSQPIGDSLLRSLIEAKGNLLDRPESLSGAGHVIDALNQQIDEQRTRLGISRREHPDSP